MTIQNLAIFTTCSNNYMPMAKVFLESARQYHPNATLYLCLADKLLPERDFYPQGCQVIPADSLDIPNFSEFSFRYDVMEFNTATKPFMFISLLKRGHDAVLYFDPDIEVFAPLDGITQELEGNASFVLTPHLLQPAEGNSEPGDVGIMRAGIYNLGFLGIGATTEVPAILDWWARRLRYQCVNEQANGLFVDQKFIDLVPGFANAVSILRAPQYNVAYWNLDQRQLVQEGVDWNVDGKKIRFFHFSGFDCTNQGVLSKHCTAFRGNAAPPPLRTLMQHYSDRVLANGYHEARDIPYAYGFFTSGAPIPTRVRRIFRARQRPWLGDPFAEFEDQIEPVESTVLPPMSADELAREVQAIYASSSWRLTRPLRAVKRLLNGHLASL